MILYFRFRKYPRKSAGRQRDVAAFTAFLACYVKLSISPRRQEALQCGPQGAGFLEGSIQYMERASEVVEKMRSLAQNENYNAESSDKGMQRRRMGPGGSAVHKSGQQSEKNSVKGKRSRS